MEDMAPSNRKIILRKRPGRLIGKDDIAIEVFAIPELADGQVLIRTDLLAMDPVTRVLINEDIGLVPPIELGQPLRSFGGGTVVESRSDSLPVGALVTDFFEWAEWQVITSGSRTQVLPAGESLVSGLNVYGHTAMAAYFGVLKVAGVLAGETVVVTGAGGAVGSVAGQIARIKGARVIGVAGGSEKCGWLTGTLGFDNAVDYRAPGWDDQLAELTPDGIDLLFDNVGGNLLGALLPRVATTGRALCCGASGQYASAMPLAPPENPGNVSLLRFNAMDYRDQFTEAAALMNGWEREGRLQFETMILEGLENAPDGLNRLFDGRSRGRVLVRVG